MSLYELISTMRAYDELGKDKIPSDAEFDAWREMPRAKDERW